MSERIKIEFDGPDSVRVDGVSNALETTADFDRHHGVVDGALARNFRVNGRLIAAGRGDENCIRMRMRDASGLVDKELLDLVVAFGAGGPGTHPGIARLVARQMTDGTPPVAGNVMHPLLMPTLLALRKISDMPDARVFFCNDSTVATSVAMRLALWRHVKKHGRTIRAIDAAWTDSRIVVAERGYHGSCDLARAVLGEGATGNFGPLPDTVLKVPFGDSAALRLMLEAQGDAIAGVLLEPVQGAGGCVAPPEGYLREVAELCRDHDVAFIADEVKSGFGRLGQFFYSSSVGAAPDIICAGKSAGGGVLPLSFVIGKPDFMQGFEHTAWGVTWSASPSQCSALLGWIKKLSDESTDSPSLLSEVRRKSLLLESTLSSLRQRFPKQVVGYDGLGLMRSLETVFDGRELADALLLRGVYTTPIVHPDIVVSQKRRVYIAPALTIREDQIRQIGTAFGDAIAALSQA